MKQFPLVILSLFFSNSNSQEKFNLENILKLETDQIVIKIDDYLNKISNYGDNIEKLNASQKTFFLIQNLEKEINNGGFNQFYFNSSGDFSHETVEALKLIEAYVTAKIVETSNSKFPNGIVPKERAKRQDVLETIDEDIELWEDQDNDFYQYQDNITKLLISFVNNNKADFEN